jgi:hypothetical protein
MSGRRRGRGGGQGNYYDGQTHRQGRRELPAGLPEDARRMMQTAVIRRGEDIDIGEIGAGDDRPPLTASFVFHGRRFRVHPDLSETTVIDFLDQAAEVPVNDPRQQTMIKEWLREHVHPGDFEAFWAVGRAQHYDSGDWLRTAWAIVEGVAARPTQQPSDYSGGPPTTSPTSPATSPRADDDPLRPAYLRHIERFEAMTDEETGQPASIGAALAAQVAVAAQARGVKVERPEYLSPSGTG